MAPKTYHLPRVDSRGICGPAIGVPVAVLIFTMHKAATGLGGQVFT